MKDKKKDITDAVDQLKAFGNAADKAAETVKALGRSIELLRMKRGITKASVISKTGLTYAQTIAIETGSKDYTVRSLVKYLDAIGSEIKLPEE